MPARDASAASTTCAVLAADAPTSPTSPPAVFATPSPSLIAPCLADHGAGVVCGGPDAGAIHVARLAHPMRRPRLA